jgi:hypothetical protein
MSQTPAPTTFADYGRSSQGTSSIFDGSLTANENSSPFENVSPYPYPYLWSNSPTYQLNPNFDIHLINNDNATGPNQTLTITLPRIQGYLNKRKVFILRVTGSHVGDTIAFVPFDTTCSINNLTAGAAYNFTVDANPRFFICVGFYIGGTIGYNQYYMVPFSALAANVSITSANALLTVAQSGNAFTLTDNVAVTAGLNSLVVANGTGGFTVSAFCGQVVAFGGATTAATTALYFALNTPSTTEASVAPWLCSQSGNISQFYVRLSANLAVATNTLTATLRKNGVATTITCVVANGTATSSDQIHFTTAALGDVFTVSSVQSATGEVVQAAFSFCFRPTAV